VKFIESKNGTITILPSLKETIISTKQKIKENLSLSRELQQLEDTWTETMAQAEIKNRSFDTFTLSHIQKKDYGYCCRVYSPKGRALEELEQKKLIIETGLKCIFQYTIPDHKEFAMAKIIKSTQVKCNEIPFTPYPVKPYEAYFGVNVAGEPIVFNLNDTPQILIAGDTGSGKNGCIDHALTSWIYSCTDRQIEIYIFQGAKNDLVKYQDCKQVKAFVLGDFEEFLKVLKYVNTEMDNRTIKMSQMVKKMKGDNLYYYNQLY
jgi:S-DNA-T family DNA segregation ATPase FtsK/SpoIIIE